MFFVYFPLRLRVLEGVILEKLLQSDELKIKILNALSNGKSYTFYALSKETGSSYDTLKPNCEFLKLIGFVQITKISKEESASKTPYTAIKITEKGIEFVRRQRSK